MRRERGLKGRGRQEKDLHAMLSRRCVEGINDSSIKALVLPPPHTASLAHQRIAVSSNALAANPAPARKGGQPLLFCCCPLCLERSQLGSSRCLGLLVQTFDGQPTLCAQLISNGRTERVVACSHEAGSPGEVWSARPIAQVVGRKLRGGAEGGGDLGGPVGEVVLREGEERDGEG